MFSKVQVRSGLAYFWSIVGASYVFGVTFYPVPESNVDNVKTILGFVLGTIVATVINYFFGSSKGSEEKTNLLVDKKSA